MSLVHFLLLKCSSVNGHPPSLLSGSHGVDSPPFQQYYEDAKTAFACLLTFGFPRLGYHSDITFSLRIYRVAISTLHARIVWVRSIRSNRFSVGGGGLSCVPVLPLSVSDMFFDPGRISPARHIRWLDIALIVLKIKASALRLISRLNSIPLTVAVYASCHHL